MIPTYDLNSVGSPPRSDSRPPIVALRSRAEDHAVVTELALRAISGASTDDLLDRCASLLASALEADLSVVSEFVPAANLLLVRATGGTQHEPASEASAFVPGDAGSLAAYVLTHGVPVLVEDLPGEQRFSPDARLVAKRMLSSLAVLIPAGGVPFGVICAHARRKCAFSEGDVQFTSCVAHVLGLAMMLRRAEAAREHAQRSATGLTERVAQIVERLAEQHDHQQREISQRGERLEQMLAHVLTTRAGEQRRRSEAARLEPLSDRERQILRLVADGQTNAEIGLKLCVSRGTIKNHVSRILTKLDAVDRTQASARAIELELLD